MRIRSSLRRRCDWLTRTLVILVATCPACGKTKVRKPTFPVKGQILLAGKPVPNAYIQFHPVDEEGPNVVRPSGRADSEGTFQLTTYQAGDGAPAGHYLVTVMARTVSKVGDSDEKDLSNRSS